MGLARVFRRSVRFTFRSKKRFLVFLIIFAIVSTVIAINVDQLQTLTTSKLLDQKGVKVYKADNAVVPYSKGNTLYNDVLNYAKGNVNLTIDSSMIYTYADISSGIRIHSLDINHPWLSDFANPSLIHSGHYPSSPNEILVPEGAMQSQNIVVNGQNVTFDNVLSVGQKLDFTNQNGKSIQLTISGTFETGKFQISNQNNSLWLFMDQSTFKNMIDLFGMSMQNDVSVYMMSFVVQGLVLTPNTYRQTQQLNDHIKSLVQDKTKYGNFGQVPASLPATQTTKESNRFIVTMIFVIFGGIILATLFAYLISRFRRREIAILKAMGYSHSATRTSLFAEIMTTSFTGFVFGVGLAQLLLVTSVLDWFTQGQTVTLDFGNLIQPMAVLVAFVIMVVIALPGMYLVSRRILSVSPAEAFRDN